METVAGVSKPSQLEWGIASSPMKGHQESGDGYVVRFFPTGALVGVIDGLGHGPDAAEAARAAIAVLEERPRDSVERLLQLCHERLQRAPRGVVMTLAAFDFSRKTVSCAGVGNVEGVLLHAGESRPRETVIPRRGVVGGRMPPLYVSTHTLSAGDTLILVTDGIRFGFGQDSRLSGSPQASADLLLREFGSGNDDALALVVRYSGLEVGATEARVEK